jgi:hypothetical protein
LDDEATIAAWRWCVTLAESGDRQDVAAALPHLVAAHAIYAGNAATRWELEARLVAGVSASAIADHMKIDTRVVDNYIGSFFDVVGHTDSIAWLGVYLPIGMWTPANPSEGQIWMHVAATGAMTALDVLAADFLRRLDPSIPDRHQVAEDIRSLVRFTCTPPTPTPAYRRLLNQMWCILTTRVMIHDPTEWQAMVGHMDLLELVAEVKQSRQPATIDSGSRAARSLAEAASGPAREIKRGVNAREDQRQRSTPQVDESEDVWSPATPVAVSGRLCWPLWSAMAGLAAA